MFIPSFSMSTCLGSLVVTSCLPSVADVPAVVFVVVASVGAGWPYLLLHSHH